MFEEVVKGFKQTWHSGWLGKLINIMFIGTLIFLIAMLGIGAARSVDKVSNSREVIVTIESKESKAEDRRTGARYLVFGVDTDGNEVVFEVTDSLFKWRWDSSDVYASIKIGKTYKLTICGKRIPFLSWYPNIYRVTEI